MAGNYIETLLALGIAAGVTGLFVLLVLKYLSNVTGISLLGKK